MTVMLGHCPQAERSRPLKVALIGECMIEMRGEPGATFSQTFGGDTLNAAVYLARVSQGSAMSVDYITAVGADAFSVAMRQMWRDEGVGDQHVRVIPDALPGLYFIQTDDQGERRFAYWRGEAAARRVFDGPEADAVLRALADYDYVYLSGISLAILNDPSRDRLMTLLKACRARGGKVIFDNNYRPRLWASKEQTQSAYNAMLSCTDIAFLTLDDEDMLWGEKPYEDVIARTHALGVSEVVVKRGADSCIVSSAEGELHDVPAVKLPKEKVVDTTAAGDSFSAGYLAVRLTGGSAVEAAVRGHETASTVIQHRGAIIPMEFMPERA